MPPEKENLFKKQQQQNLLILEKTKTIYEVKFTGWTDNSKRELTENNP